MYSYSPYNAYFNDFFGKNYSANKPYDFSFYGFQDEKQAYPQAPSPYEQAYNGYTPYYNAPYQYHNAPDYKAYHAHGFNPYFMGYNPYAFFQNKFAPYFDGNNAESMTSNSFYAKPFSGYPFGFKGNNPSNTFNYKFFDTDGEYTYECYSPYFDHGKVDVSFTPHGLKIRYKQDGVWSHEYYMVDMPMDVDYDKVSAKASKGYLHITLPRKSKAVESFRKVKVN